MWNKNGIVGVLIVLAAGCGERPPAEDTSRETTPAALTDRAPQAASTIDEAERQLSDSLRSVVGVVGTMVGECDGDPCLRVLVAKKTEELTRRIPETFAGFRVMIDESGEISAQDSTL